MAILNKGFGNHISQADTNCLSKCTQICVHLLHIVALSLVFQEYADNVLGTGIHGALLFLERGTFTSQQLASALKISSSKTQLRKKLTSKLIQLFSEEAVNRYEIHHYPAHRVHKA